MVVGDFGTDIFPSEKGSDSHWNCCLIPFFALPLFPAEVKNHFKGSDVLVPDATQLLLEEFEI